MPHAALCVSGHGALLQISVPRDIAETLLYMMKNFQYFFKNGELEKLDQFVFGYVLKHIYESSYYRIKNDCMRMDPDRFKDCFK